MQNMFEDWKKSLGFWLDFRAEIFIFIPIGIISAMKFLRIGFFVAVFLSLARNIFGQSFVNLNFEQARIQPAPPNYTPSDAYNPISAASALPGWTVMEDSTVCTAIWGAPVALDETSVALLTANNGYYSGYVPLQGSYSVQFYAYANAPLGYFHTASISQTGQIPFGAQSIQFLMESPPVAGSTIQASPLITINGAPISISPISTSGGVETMAGDIGAYAGMTVDLEILCQATPGYSVADENIFTLDDIQFSTSPVPEPTTLSLFAIGILFLRWRRKPSVTEDSN